MRYTVLRFALVTVAAGGLAPAAPAFYWVGWPGAGTTQPPSIVSQTERVEYRPPPGVRTPEPPGGERPPEDPKGVPEPATLAMVGAGLGVLAVRWVRKRKK